MTDEEFIAKSKEILDRHGLQFSRACDDNVTLYLGDFGYMKREQLIKAARAIIELETLATK